jgi:hypothetical protein
MCAAPLDVFPFMRPLELPRSLFSTPVNVRFRQVVFIFQVTLFLYPILVSTHAVNISNDAGSPGESVAAFYMERPSPASDSGMTTNIH